MPAIAHLAPRFIEGGGSGAITATGIGLIVGVGIIPAIILLWVCCWLMICYPHDRTCWCTKSRKRKARESQGDVANIPSEETLREKPVQNVSRPAANYRSDSGSSDESARMQRERGAPIKTHATRMSVQSVGSHSTIAVQQEPQKFV